MCLAVRGFEQGLTAGSTPNQIMDATGSMGSYIASATKNIEAICEHVSLLVELR